MDTNRQAVLFKIQTIESLEIQQPSLEFFREENNASIEEGLQGHTRHQFRIYSFLKSLNSICAGKVLCAKFQCAL